MKIKLFVILASILLTITGCNSGDLTSVKKSNVDEPSKIRLDYAHYSPTSLILKEFSWVEEEFEGEGIEIEWVLSQGSNKSLEYLNSNSVDFGSTAGAAAFISKANGSPIKNIYIFSKPEWTALVTNQNSEVKEVSDLAGKRVAATLGTDPYIFLLRTLNAEGISVEDVEIVNLQHGDGASSLISGSADAWAGLDPHMARLEVEVGAELFYREVNFNTYGFLNVREEFAEDYPSYVLRVIQVYEKARKWAIENPEETAELLANEADIPLEVANIQIERTDYSDPIPGKTHKEALIEAGKVLQESDVIESDIDLVELATNLIDKSYAKKVINE